jgi:hypothetical protein
MTLLPSPKDRKLVLWVAGLTLSLVLHAGAQIFEMGKLVQKVDDLHDQVNRLEWVVMNHIAK